MTWRWREVWARYY